MIKGIYYLDQKVINVILVVVQDNYLKMDIFVKIDYIDTDLHIKVDTYIIFYTMIKIDIEGKIIIEDQDFDLKVEMEVKM